MSRLACPECEGLYSSRQSLQRHRVKHGVPLPALVGSRLSRTPCRLGSACQAESVFLTMSQKAAGLDAHPVCQGQMTLFTGAT